jgi:ribosomal protein S18 acetylase RimI-like enzyme
VRTALILRELSQTDFLAEVEAFAAIYAVAMNADAAQLPGRRAIMERHAGNPGFRAFCVAGASGPAAHAQRPGGQEDLPARREQPIAFGYGFHGQPGQWWHDTVRWALTAASGAGVAAAWLGDTFEVAEVHVRPDHQGHGIGKQLLLSLTAGRPERCAVLSTHDQESRARRLYRSLGFTDLLTNFSFPGGGPAYAVMGAVLPLCGSPAAR